MDNPEKKDLTKQEINVDNIWKQLKQRALGVRYGSFTVKFDIHDGQVRLAHFQEEWQTIKP